MRLSVRTDAAKPIVADLANYVDRLFTRVGALRLTVDDKGLQASLTRDYAELLRLSKVVASPRLTLLGATRAQAELLALDASMDAAVVKMKALQDAQSGMADSGMRWFGVINALTSKVSLFGGALSAVPFLKSIAVWHILADVAVEFLAVLIPATVALVAFGAAGAPAAQEVAKQMQNVQTVTEATGKSLYPLTGQFTKVADAVRPQVYQLFGDMLTIANAKTKQFTDLASAAGQVVDKLGARIAVAIQTGGLSKFLANAASDLAKLGDVVGNIFGTIGNLLHAMPGIAQILLNVVDTSTKAIESFTGSGFVQGVIKVGLAFHGAAIYIGLLATGVAFLASRGLAGIASVATKAAGGLAGMGKFGAGAAIQMDRLAAGASTAAALPWGWIALAAAAFGFLAFKIITAKDATQQWINALEQNLGAQNAVAGFTVLQLDQTAVAGRLATVQRGVTVSYKQMGGAAGELSRQGASVHASYLSQANAASELGKAQIMLNNQSALYTSRLDRMGAAFGGVGTAQGLLIASGVKMSDMLKFGTLAWLQDLQQVSATAAAYKAMGQTGTTLGADMNALNIAASDQVVQMGKLNTAWDKVIGIVSGGQSSFITYEQDILSINQAYKQVGGTGRIVTTTFDAVTGKAKTTSVSMNGLSAASLQLRGTWQTAFTGASTLIDSLRMMSSISPGGFPSVAEAMKLTIAQLVPLGKTSAATRTELVQLAQEIDPNIHNFSQLTTWLGNTHDAGKRLNDLVSKMGVNLKDLAKDAANLSATMQTQMNATFSAARLAASGVNTAVTNLGKAMGQTHPNMKQIQSDAQILYEKLVNNHIMAPKVANDFVTALDPAFKRTGDAAGNNGAAGQVQNFVGKMSTAKEKAVSFVNGSPYKATVSVLGKGSGLLSYELAIPHEKTSTGHLEFHAAGGIVGGSGNTDTVHAMLTPGEVVVPKKMVAGGAVDHLRGQLPGFAAGGVVGSLTGPASPLIAAQPFMSHAETTFAKMAETAFATAAWDALKSAVTAAGSGSGTAIANYAKTFLGRIPYVWGGVAVPGGADCSGFVETIYKHFGIFSPRTSEAQGAWVRRSAPTPGGLAFYNSPAGGPPPGHVAIVAADASHVISQGGGMGPQWETLHFAPLMWTGVPPHGFGLAGGAGGTQGQGQLESLWVQAGGASSLAHIMSAIAEAESGGNASARNPSGASGLWQILMPANQRYVHGNVFNPLVNARAAVAIERVQGLNAWSTFTSGAYQHFMNAGGLVMDRGGWIPPGASIVVNKTGRPEHLTPSGGDSPEVVQALRRIERHLRAGNAISARAPAQTGVAFGRTLQGVSARAVSHGVHAVRRPVA